MPPPKSVARPTRRPEAYEDIEMPRNTGIGFILCVLSGIWMFALVWWIWWLAALMTVLMHPLFIVWTFDDQIPKKSSPPKRCANSTKPGWRLVHNATAVDRDHETAPENRGLARPDLEAVT